MPAAGSFIPCSPRSLQHSKRHSAAVDAIRRNPANRPRIEAISRILQPGCPAPTPEAIAVLTTKWWGSEGVRLGVSFLEPTPPALRDRIISHMNAWGAYANVQFAYSRSKGEVRITREGEGYWSYLGTDVLHIAPGEPTMCLQDFAMSTPESEYKRVVRHETGHTLGFPHEHMRSDIVKLLDPIKTQAYFQRTQGWSEDEILQQVLTPIEESSVNGTPVDVESIMCYQLPGSITYSGQPIPGGTDIDPIDGQFAAKLYPKSVM